MSHVIYRNWIEEAMQKTMKWDPILIGMRFGKALYTICWLDGTEGDYFIDFENKTIEQY